MSDEQKSLLGDLQAMLRTLNRIDPHLLENLAAEEQKFRAEQHLRARALTMVPGTIGETHYAECHFKYCDLCGELQWTQSSVPVAKRPDEPVIHFEQMPSYGCYRCIEVSQRDPELADWVRVVVCFQGVLRKWKV